jgi:tRNA A-37 threonylcarbamoyl transferase component Bud32
MTVDAELANWGEPPVSRTEEVLLAVLDRFLDHRARGEEVRPDTLLADTHELAADGAALLRAAECVEQFVATILEHSGIQGDPVAPSAAATELYEGDMFGTAEPLPDPFPGLYRIQRFLGKGRFGRVWLADHLRFQIPVALKALLFHVSGEARALAQAALENEARVLARMGHPNIVRVYALEQAADGFYLVLQYVDGGSLEARLEQDGPLGWQLAARYIADVGEALVHIHGQGLVHRDVKPANILWDRQRDEALLTDFGLAARLAEAGQVAGTPLYMAPEAFAGWSTPAGDVYSLAASLFTLMTGRVPFPAQTPEELLERIQRGLPDLEPLFAGVPERLERIIRSGLAAAPANRPELRTFVADLRGALNRLLADSLVLPALTAGRAGPVEMRLTVARWEGGTTFVPVAETHPQPRGMTRDLTRVPPPPARASLRTGDRVRIEVVADRDGFVTVFNVGPTGHLNLLYPEQAPTVAPPPLLPAHRPLHIADVALTPPAGGERLFAVWSRVPLPLPLEELFRLAREEKEPVSPAYRSTRNMERVQASVQQLRPADWRAVVVELDHGSG